MCLLWGRDFSKCVCVHARVHMLELQVAVNHLTRMLRTKPRSFARGVDVLNL